MLSSSENVVDATYQRITNNHILFQSKQQTQATDIQDEEIRTCVNSPNVESNSEKLWVLPRSHKIRSTFYTESTLHKLLCKPKNRVATKDKNNIVYEIDCGNGEAVYFGESKQSLKLGSDECKISVRNCSCENNKTTKQCQEADRNFSLNQKKTVDAESRFIYRKIKETINSLKNPHPFKQNFLHVS